MPNNIHYILYLIEYIFIQLSRVNIHLNLFFKQKHLIKYYLCLRYFTYKHFNHFVSALAGILLQLCLTL